jgi:hypothetical protein
MARERSPNYPVYNLPAAIQYARMIWEREKRTPTEMGVLATALGSTVVSGPVRSKVSSMRQYGLLEPVQGGLKVCDRALTLILQRAGQAEYDKAAEAAALAPPLFKELREDRPDASDEALNIYLVRDRGFSTEGAKKAIAAYRVTMAFAKLDGMSYPVVDEAEPSEPGEREPEERSATAKASAANYVTFSFSLPSGVRAEVSFSGSRPPTRRDAQKLRQYLELFEDDLEQPEGTTVRVAIADEVDLT